MNIRLREHIALLARDTLSPREMDQLLNGWEEYFRTLGVDEVAQWQEFHQIFAARLQRCSISLYAPTVEETR